MVSPRNAAGFQNLLSKMAQAGLGECYTEEHWSGFEKDSLCQVPRWYRSLLMSVPLANVIYTVVDPTAYHPPRPPGWTDGCVISKGAHWRDLAGCDCWLRDEIEPFTAFREQWFPFATSTSLAGPDFWVVPADEAAEPVVHAFSGTCWDPDCNSGTWSTGLHFEDFILSASALERAARR